MPITPITPNKERIRLFVNALRSGKYRQGRGKLAEYKPEEKRVRYCCLGVACEVAKANGLELRRERVDFEYGYAHDQKGLDTSLLPRSVRDWFGFDSENPLLVTSPRDYYAVDCNDELRWPFQKIADAFENKYLKDDETPQ